ncbi:MAG TPA: bifunctional methionine sulfoxide reductase B/A protein [Tepidisphaeraceae bacterium]|nr:bifunctional methionine sulfoxide reductase B/A protein [Tepidisphaeraceae bacterium]
MRVLWIIAVLVGLPFALLACNRENSAIGASPATAAGQGNTTMAYVRVIDPEGNLSAPVVMPKVVRTEEEWKKRLTPEQHRITRTAGTEAAFCGGLLNNKEAGIYLCIGCDLPLFRSDAKFESGTGWPSFFQPVASENVREKPDFSHGMVRTEINCARCDSHLGHLFDDGPRPTGLRFCLNSESLKFVKNEDLKKYGQTVPTTEVAEAVLAGGCFWCVEGVFEELAGVHDVISGYAGGDKATANYQAVSSGGTKHAEAVKIIYDPKQVSYEQLLKVHFATHDPTTKDRQGNDVGPQYRSAIFYADEQEKRLAEAFIEDITESGVFKRPIVTTVEPLTEFFPAEAYHQNYVCRNPSQSYVRSVALPKVEKVRKEFKDMLKPHSTQASE